MNVIEPDLIRADFAATLCGVSRVTWLRWRSSGKVPEPIRIGRTVLWSRADIGQWIEAGCPNASAWRSMKGRDSRKPIRFPR